MLEIGSVVEAWDWHVAGQAVRVFRPGWAPGELSAGARRRGVCEPWGFAGLLGAALSRKAEPVFWDATGEVLDSASGRLALLAAQAWEQGDCPATELPVALARAVPAPGPLSGLYWVPDPLGAVVLAGSRPPMPLDWAHLDALGALAAAMRQQAGRPTATAVVADVGRRRAVGIRASGECWRGPADVLPAALSAALALGWGAAELSGDWTGPAELAVGVHPEGDGRAALRARAHLIALRRFYDRPGAMPPFVLS